ncbi:acyltransferase family protein [Acidisoma sp.]|uniref:acyltransferase family protein n=1 Tax=Acidisoma sp. TaxID=1872115 RepID=UPI003B004FB6
MDNVIDSRSAGIRTGRFNSIQVLRALAAVSVVLFHSSVFGIGYSGVDIFFVISGFIMGTIGVNERPAVFVTNRLIRIVPLYWAVTLAICVLSFIPGAFKTFTFDVQTLTKSLLFVPYYDQTGHIWPLIVPGWSLNYELFFYVIFAVGLCFRRAISFTIPVMVVLVLAGALLPSESPLVHTYTNALLLEFAAGLALAQFQLIKGLWLGLALLAAGIALFVHAGFAQHSDVEGFSRLMIFGVPAILVVAGALFVERAGYWPRMKPLEAIGDASYSLYLLHGFAVAFFHKFLHLPTPQMAVVIVVSSLIGALLSYRYFERPVARLLRTTIGRRTALGPRLATG